MELGGNPETYVFSLRTEKDTFLPQNWKAYGFTAKTKKHMKLH